MSFHVQKWLDVSNGWLDISSRNRTKGGLHCSVQRETTLGTGCLVLLESLVVTIIHHTMAVIKLQ